MTIYDQKTPQKAGVNSGPQLTQAPRGPAAQTGVPQAGPLTRTVQQAQQTRGKGEQDWNQVAEQVAQKYQALGNQVAQADLVAALRAIPDTGVQESLVARLGGKRVENLREALAYAENSGQEPLNKLQVVAKKAPAKPETTSPTSKAKAQAGQQNKVAQKPVAKKPEAAAQKAAPKPKLSLKKPAAKGSVASPSAGAKSAPKGKAASTAKKGAARQAAPKNAPAKAAAKQGGGGQGDLKVMSQATLAGLNVKLNPTLRQGDKMVFAPAAWRAAEQQVRQAVKVKEAGQAAGGAGSSAQGQGQGQAQGSPAGVVQAAPQAKKAKATQKAIKLPSATIKAADIKRHEQQNRQKNQQKLQATTAKAKKARASLNGLAAKATPPINAAQKAAEAQISAALQRTLGQIKTAEASARSTIASRATAAQAAVNAAYQSTIQGIRQDTTQKINQLKQSAQTLKTQLTTEKATLDQKVTQEFTTAQQGMISAGQNVAGTARGIGETWAAKYRAEPVPEQGFWEGLANGDDYYKNKQKARVEAAIKTGEGYAKGMTDAGNEQAKSVGESLPDALAANTKLLSEYQKTVDKFVSGQVTGLQTQQTTALQAAATQRTALLTQITQQKTQAQASITQAATQGRSQATTQAAQSKSAAAKQGSQAIASVRTQAQRAGQQMDAQIQNFQKSAQAQLGQDAADFTKAISGFEGYVKRGGSGSEKQILASSKSAAAGIKASAAPAARGLTSLGTSTASSLKAQGTQVGASLTEAGRAGQTGMKQMLTGHTKSTAAVLKAAGQQMQKFTQGFTTDGGKVVQNVHTELDKAVQGFPAALTNVLNSGSGETPAEATAIQAEATKAADAVQPRWKSILKVVIDVVIAVATIAAVIALSAVLGPVALVLAGMAIGALGAMAGQGLKDVVDGKFSGWQAYGAAALGGAIGGAFGGAGGAVGGLFAKGLVGGLAKQGFGRLAQGAARIGTEAVINTGFDLAGQVATGYANQAVFNQPYDLKSTFSAKNVLMTAAMNTAGTAIASPSAMKFVGNKLSNINIPGKGLLGKFQNSLSNTRVVKGINAIDGRINSSSVAKKFTNGIENFGQRTGEALGGAGVKAGAKVGDVTGIKAMPVRTQENPNLNPGEARVTGYKDGETTVEFGPNTSQAVKDTHIKTARDVRSANGLPRKVSDKLQELSGRTPTKGGTEKARLEAEASKHQELAKTYREAAETFEPGTPQRQHYEEQAKVAEDYAKDYATNAAKTDPNLPDSKGFVETRMRSGAVEASNRKWADAPKGYQWELYENGDLILKKLDKNLPTMEYKPGENPPRTGKFVQVDEATTPAIKGETKIFDGEDGTIEALKQQVDELLRLRAAKQTEIDNLKRTSSMDDPNVRMEYERMQAYVREQSRLIGEEAGKAYVTNNFDSSKLIYPPEGVSNSRSGDFDQIWQVRDKDGKTKIIVVEAKGGDSSLGRRRDYSPSAKNPYAEQGSKEYFESIVKNMLASKNGTAAAEQLQMQYLRGNVEYIEVRAPIDSKKMQFPDGVEGYTNNVLEIEVTPFEIYPKP